MSERNLHAKPFDSGTTEKLAIYRGYLREWLPVFLHAKSSLSRIQIFDFFAGPGMDIEGNSASPVIALEEIHAALERAAENGQRPIAVDLYLNELSKKKYDELVERIQTHEYFKEVNVSFQRKDFPVVFEEWYPLMKRPGVANFLFLDQNGVKQVSTDIFRQIASLRYTDYMFYIASSIVNRFKEDPIIVDPLPLTKSDLDRMNGTNVHGIIKDAYQRVVPNGFLAPFSIRKGANVYGLIFGSEHTLGLEKFLTLCWKLDKVHGLANFDVECEDISYAAPHLFEEMDRPKKLDVFERDLSDAILKRNVETNHQVYEFALRKGFLPSHARAVVKTLIDQGRIPSQQVSISRDCERHPPVAIKLFKKGAS